VAVEPPEYDNARSFKIPSPLIVVRPCIEDSWGQGAEVDILKVISMNAERIS
jgi:hypothetical protein